MSFINPEKVPVFVYKSTDTDAPRLDRSANCVETIFKACLVTGYGSKQGAGWTMPFEDQTNGIKVFRPVVSAEQDFYLKLSNDTGREVAIQVYTSMSDVNNGDLKLQCATLFKYAVSNETSKSWILIASGRSVWFFCETANKINTKQSGAYFYCGDTGKGYNGIKGLYLIHTGGNYGVTSSTFDGILSAKNDYLAIDGKLLLNQAVYSLRPTCLFSGNTNLTTNAFVSQLLLIANNDIVAIPAFAPSNMSKNNYDVLIADNRQFVNHSTSTNTINNLYVPIDYWEY